MEIKTFLDIAEIKGQSIATVSKAYARKFPDRKFRQKNVLKEDELSFFLGETDIQKPTKTDKKTRQKTDKTETMSNQNGQLREVKTDNYSPFMDSSFKYGGGLAPDMFKADAPPKKETFAPSAKFLRSDSFLFIALAASMLTQMIHTGGFFFNNSPTQEPELRIVWAAVFAIGVDCTALVMTIRRGGRGFLWAFAGIHFAMNIALHTQVHEDPTWGAIFGYILLSGVIAFSNFSYTDLFRK